MEYQLPVNFGDGDSNEQRPQPGPSRRTPAPSTQFSMPGVSRPVSGITATDDWEHDEYGRTHAQQVAEGYLAYHGEGRDAEPSFDDVEFGDRPLSQQRLTHTAQPSLENAKYEDAESVDAMTYVDEHFNTYSSRRRPPPDLEQYTEKANPRAMSERVVQDMEYAEPRTLSHHEESASRFGRYFERDTRQYPIEQKIESKRRGTLVRQSRPYMCWVLAVVMTAVIIYELVANYKAQKQVFSFHPFVNPMLGPSQATLINVGARFTPCMRLVTQVPPTLEIACPSNTANPPTDICTVEQVCGHGGFGNGTPNQWWRFISPIFLHAGLIHLLINMFVQLTISAQIEKEVGSPAFLIIYFAAGIFGNVLGGNFMLVGLPSVGASGAIFGTLGALWVDLVAHWRFVNRPYVRILILLLDLVFAIVLGYAPGVDTFAHLGGILMGSIAAMAVYPIISETRRHRLIVWILRILALIIALILYITLTRNFYTSDPTKACKWCRYLSCIPTAGNNHCQGTGISMTSPST